MLFLSPAFIVFGAMAIQLYHHINTAEKVFSEEELRRKNRIANNICYILNSVGVVLSVFGGLLAADYITVVWMLLCFPVITLIVFYYLDKIVSWVDDYWDAIHLGFTLEITVKNLKRALHPSMFIAVLMPITSLAMVLFAKYRMVGQVSYFAGIIPAVVFLFIVLGLINQGKISKLKLRPAYLAGLCVFVLLFAYSTAMMANCVYDDSAPTVYQVPITAKYISNNTPCLLLDHWGPVQKNMEIQVERKQFFRNQVGKTVAVYLKKGGLHMAWYEIGLNDKL